METCSKAFESLECLESEFDCGEESYNDGEFIEGVGLESVV